ncbi:HEPN domain-containing protein [Lutibacter sp. A80]|uniref:HEPN domain-containing protein n=1 Tax=Lutibacter sp. A80 TaxID=2918453 RepID=UPI001F06FB37|nr:HEPN domain-containing protein [Lutibacter sp. A80]UMB60723.1 HEPN domain-containing protein [Lutibacter sp. A80]
MKSRSKAFFKEATKNLQLAKNEMFKPAEDIVTYSICKNAQFAIENYLRGYLIKNEVEVTSNETISSLYNKCVSVDENFKNIDINAIGCKDHAIDSRYCSEINSVSACFDTADSIDTYLRKIDAL